MKPLLRSAGTRASFVLAAEIVLVGSATTRGHLHEPDKSQIYGCRKNMPRKPRLRFFEVFYRDVAILHISPFASTATGLLLQQRLPLPFCVHHLLAQFLATRCANPN